MQQTGLFHITFFLPSQSFIYSFDFTPVRYALNPTEFNRTPNSMCVGLQSRLLKQAPNNRTQINSVCCCILNTA